MFPQMVAKQCGCVVGSWIVGTWMFRRLSMRRIDRMFHSNRGAWQSSHAIVCMIDLCNFSTWCYDKSSEEVMRAMFEYNRLINRRLKRLHRLEKIELVGDCAMIVGWKNESDDGVVMREMSEFAMNMLQHINTIRSIFKDDTLSIRIGIHEGVTSCGFMSNPRKFQMFGSTVNVASRIESAADNGTCLVSDDCFRSTQNYDSVKYFCTITPKGALKLKGMREEVTCSKLEPNFKSRRSTTP